MEDPHSDLLIGVTKFMGRGCHALIFLLVHVQRPVPGSIGHGICGSPGTHLPSSGGLCAQAFVCFVEELFLYWYTPNAGKAIGQFRMVFLYFLYLCYYSLFLFFL